MSKIPLRKLNRISVNGRDSSFVHKMWNFQLLSRFFALSFKTLSATTFNIDICSLGLVHYADNSHHSCRGPTFEKYLFVWENGKDVF